MATRNSQRRGRRPAKLQRERGRRRPSLNRARLGRLPAALSRGALARLSANFSSERVARFLAAHSSERLARFLAKHSTERLGHAVALALVLLLGGGTAAALALLPSDRRDGGPEGGSGAPSRFAQGELVALGSAPRRGGPAYYRTTTSKHVPATGQPGFMALYREAGRTFGVSWRLLASIHRQETAFSTAPTTYHGLNPFGCCAGPMQFNVTNGPPSTWALYRQAFRHGDRPSRYPHPTRHHPSIYDDFDAIMAAGKLLKDSGASAALDGGSWSAAYAYYGHDLFGIDYASQVLGRARTWERDGFCLNCREDPALVAAFDDAYGVDARRQFLAAQERDKQDKKRKKAKRKRDRAEAAKEARERARQRALQRRSDARERARRVPIVPHKETAPTPSPSPPTTTAPPPPPADAAPEPAPPPPPAETACPPLKRLLGCGG